MTKFDYQGLQILLDKLLVWVLTLASLDQSSPNFLQMLKTIKSQPSLITRWIVIIVSRPRSIATWSALIAQELWPFSAFTYGNFLISYLYGSNFNTLLSILSKLSAKFYFLMKFIVTQELWPLIYRSYLIICVSGSSF